MRGGEGGIISVFLCFNIQLSPASQQSLTHCIISDFIIISQNVYNNSNTIVSSQLSYSKSNCQVKILFMIFSQKFKKKT